MTMTTNIKRAATAMACAGLILLGVLATGCDDYVAAGDFSEPSVQPADFSPYGYDYDMYDIFTSDI